MMAIFLIGKYFKSHKKKKTYSVHYTQCQLEKFITLLKYTVRVQI